MLSEKRLESCAHGVARRVYEEGRPLATGQILDPFPRRRFPLLSPRHYRLNTFGKRISPRCRALLSGRDVARVRHDAMGVASWRAGCSLPLRYRNGLSGRERRLINKASSTYMTLLSTPSAEGTVSRSICPAALRGALRRPRWTTR